MRVQSIVLEATSIVEITASNGYSTLVWNCKPYEAPLVGAEIRLTWEPTGY